jgi:ABC-type multidrug transport system fused ATPase/permease subunit
MKYADNQPSFRVQAQRVLDQRIMRRFAALSLGSVLAAGLDAIGIILLVPLIESLSTSGSSPALGTLPVLGEISIGWLLALVVIFFTAKSVAMAVIRWWSVGVILEASAVTATRLFGAYLCAPLAFHDEHNSSSSMRTTTTSVQEFFQRGVLWLATGVAEVATLLVLALVVMVAAPIPALIGAVYFGGASLFYVKVLQRRTRRDAAIAVDKAATVLRLVSEGLGGLREHKLRQSEAGLLRTFGVDRRAQAQALRFTTFAGELSRYYLEILMMGGFGIIAGIVVATSADPSEGLATLAVLLAVAFRMLPSLSRLLAAFTNVKVGRAALAAITSDMDDLGVSVLTDPPIGVTPTDAPPISPSRLTVTNVSFRYRNSPAEALRNITFMVEPGKSLGVVGPSGAGKSTLIDVVCGLRVPVSGSVLIDEHPVTDRTGRRGQIGLVPQDVFLADATIAENVSFGLPLAEDRLWEALGRAQLASFVRDLPLGAHTMVGERGTRLSGGQRQRIGIARALYAHPSVLVLDEATAALDVETEAAVVESVAALAGELTLIVVAHRLSTIRRCDQVAYLEAGHIRYVGTFEETAASVPEFARAVDLAGLRRTGKD